MIVAVGEALVDLKVTGEGIEAHLGGGPFNTARGLGRLEAPVTFLGRLSRDRFGQQLRASLEEAGAVVPSSLRTDLPTTLAMAEVDASGAASYQFYFDGTSVPGLTIEAARAAMPAQVDALHLGTLGLALSPIAETSTALAAEVDDDTLVYVDPNIRPAVIGDHEHYMTALIELFAHTDVVKVSDDDLRWMFPDVDEAVAVSAVLTAGPKTMFLTRGSKGVDVIGRGLHIPVPAPQVEVVDTIGAGDSFSAGVLAWWLANGKPDLGEPEPAVEAALYGAQVAAITVARAGADSPYLSELD